MNLQDVIMIIVLGFLVFYFFWWPDLKRTRSLKSKAKELNFPFYKKGDDSLLDKLKYFYLFSISDRHKIKNMLHQGNDELDIAFFDYSFVIGGGFNDGKPGTGATYATSAVYFCSTKLDLPQFALEPEKNIKLRTCRILIL